MNSPKPARALALAGVTLMTLAVTPAPVAGEARPARIKGEQPDPVRWLPQPGDTDPVRGRSVASEVRQSARRMQETAVAYPVNGRHDYGEAIARFGSARSGHTHAGQDVFAAEGTPLVAVRNGVVLEAGSDGGRGNYVAVYSPEARKTFVYLHMVAPAGVSQGDRVKAGDKLGGAGCTGSCEGVHLHFEVRGGRGLTAEAVDPLPLLQRWENLERA